MPDDPDLKFLVQFLLGLVLGVPVGAFVLQVTCGCFNRFFVKDSKSVPVPPFERAAWIIFLSLCARGAAAYVVSWAVFLAMPWSSFTAERYELIATLILFPLGLVILAAFVWRMLPASLA